MLYALKVVIKKIDNIQLSTVGQIYLWQHRTKPVLRALHASCLHIFRHIAQVLLGGRQPAGVELVQSDEKPNGAICAQALYGVALHIIIVYFGLFFNPLFAHFA